MVRKPIQQGPRQTLGAECWPDASPPQDREMRGSVPRRTQPPSTPSARHIRSRNQTPQGASPTGSSLLQWAVRGRQYE